MVGWCWAVPGGHPPSLPSFQAFLVPAPHKRELQMEEGPAQQYQRLAEHLHRAVFPEFVSSPSLQVFRVTSK